MPLNMTKIAYRIESFAELQQRLRARHEAENGLSHTTRYRPKRYEEMIGGSLYWIIAHRIMARTEILGFEAAPDGRTRILLSPKLVPVRSRAKRAHQGWRYLEEQDAPADLDGDEDAMTAMPARMIGDLTKLGLI
ncbi:DUF1489 family protein [Novosphingopyxis sp.]|uniref:DUF1489 family protein n=1 Tax=Novosphingopyxis sp. TaxID=2709690 RepID=UPI003B5A0868